MHTYKYIRVCVRARAYACMYTLHFWQFQWTLLVQHFSAFEWFWSHRRICIIYWYFQTTSCGRCVRFVVFWAEFEDVTRHRRSHLNIKVLHGSHSHTLSFSFLWTWCWCVGVFASRLHPLLVFDVSLTVFLLSVSFSLILLFCLLL